MTSATYWQNYESVHAGLNSLDALASTLDWNLRYPDTNNVITYTFNVLEGTEAQTYGVSTPNLAAFNTTQRAATRTALDKMTAITGITFTEVSSGTADIHFAATDIADSSYSGYAWTRMNWRSRGGEITSATEVSYVYLDNVEFAASNAAPTPGSWGFETLLHEIGHAMGLKHPFEGNDTLSNGEDTADNTLMSYTHTTPHSDYSPYDVAALRYLYGTDGLQGAGRGPFSTGDYILTQSGNDRYTGGSGADYAELGEGDDSVSMMAGNDTVFGGAGADVIQGNGGADLLYGGPGDDQLYGGVDDDQILAGLGNDSLVAGTGDDLLRGGYGADTLYGARGNDLLFGGPDDDLLVDGAGNDTMTGGLGADRFVFAAGSGHDVILDFNASEGDRIVLSGLSYSLSSGSAGDGVLVFSNADSLTLTGITSAQVAAGWFASA